MKKLFCIAIGIVVHFSAPALMDTKNGNYTKTFVDISFPGAGLPFKVERTYNSRSLYRGLFGYGWCSNLETRIDVLPDNTLNLVECGGGREIPYVSRQAAGNKEGMIQQIMAEVRKKKGLSKKYIAKVERDLRQSSLLQSELIRAFGLKGKVQKGQTYSAVGRQNETIVMKNNKYVRRMANGEVQTLDLQGRLVRISNKLGHWVNIQRKKGKISKIMNNKGKSLRFSYNKDGFSIQGSGKRNAVYKIANDNLVSVVDSTGKTTKYMYDSFHNMTKTRYSDGTSESLTYNSEKDWVTSFRNRQNCRESYEYKTNKRNKDHYWTTVKKVCGKRVTNQSRYEFWNKSDGQGGKYLFRAKQEVNGRVSDITYAKNTGQPLSITRNRIKTKYAYYPDGTLRTRSQAGSKVTFLNYNKKCRKPQMVVVEQIRGKKVVKKTQTRVQYDPKLCYMMRASQPGTGRWVVVQRDTLGRISKMEDQSKKSIIVQYNEKLNKPARIIRPGLGAIQVSYNKNGQVDPAKTKTNPTVAAQVANVFNGFLEVISPVAVDINI